MSTLHVLNSPFFKQDRAAKQIFLDKTTKTSNSIMKFSRKPFEFDAQICRNDGKQVAVKTPRV